MPSLNHVGNRAVLPGEPGFGRMSAADFNAHLLANPALLSGTKRRNGTAKGAKRNSPEENLHRLVFQWIFAMEKTHPILNFMMHTPNGGARSKGEAGKLKAMGVRKGISDIICPFSSGPWKGFACELKAPGGRCTPEQSEYLEHAKANEWLTGVCFELDEFVEMAQLYLGKSTGILSSYQFGKH